MAAITIDTAVAAMTTVATGTVAITAAVIAPDSALVILLLLLSVANALENNKSGRIPSSTLYWVAES